MFAIRISTSLRRGTCRSLFSRRTRSRREVHLERGRTLCLRHRLRLRQVRRLRGVPPVSKGKSTGLRCKTLGTPEPPGTDPSCLPDGHAAQVQPCVLERKVPSECPSRRRARKGMGGARLEPHRRLGMRPKDREGTRKDLRLHPPPACKMEFEGISLKIAVQTKRHSGCAPGAGARIRAGAH